VVSSLRIKRFADTVKCNAEDRTEKWGAEKCSSPTSSECMSRAADDRFNERIETQRALRTQRKTYVHRKFSLRPLRSLRFYLSG